MNILISTGDLSGDFIGSLLVKELKSLRPGIMFYGIGGENLKAEEVHILEESSDWSAIGIFDALSKVPSVYGAYRRIKKNLPALRLNGVIYLDCPAFNVLLSKAVYPLKIPSVYFFPPSAWRNDPARAARVGNYVTRVIAPFRQTESLYKSAGVPTFFSGHPLVDIVDGYRKSGDTHPIFSPSKIGWVSPDFQKLGLDPKRPVIGLFPGSRTQEIKYLLPIILETANRLYLENPTIQFALAIAHPALEEAIVRGMKPFHLPIVLGHQSNYTIMQASDVLLLASGTATLEAALFLKPMVIVYKVSEWTWRLQAPFLKGVSYAGLPNLLGGKEIVPEFLQKNATPEKIGEAMKSLLYSPEKRVRMIEGLKTVRASLGEPGALSRAAKAILETFHG